MQQKRHGNELASLSRLEAALRKVGRAIVGTVERTEFLRNVCCALVKEGGFQFAWIGRNDSEKRKISLLAQDGNDQGLLALFKSTEESPTWELSEEALPKTLPYTCNDILQEPETDLLSLAIKQSGFRALAVLPLEMGGHAWGCLNILSTQPGAFQAEEMTVLTEAAVDISCALENMERWSGREQAERLHQISEKRLRAYVEQAADCMFVHDHVGRILDVNPQACASLGYSREELLAMSLFDFETNFDLSAAKAAWSQMIPGHPLVLEGVQKRKDGSTFPVEARLGSFDMDGNRCYFAIARDISERKRMEGRFRRLVDSNAQGVMFRKTTGEITEANDAFLAIVGYSREDLRAGRINALKLNPPEYADSHQNMMEEIYTEGICTPFGKEYIRKDGTRIPVLVGAASFEDNPKEGVCFVVDLTDRKKLEHQFLRAQRMESIGTLAGGIAHDLNNILSPILIAADILKSTLSEPSSLQLVETISESALRGANMVKQVLSFARGVEGERAPVNVGKLIYQVRKIAEDTFPRNITTHAEIASDLQGTLADATQLHQVLLNLCVNARDAMVDGGKLTLTARNVMIDSQYAAMNIDAKTGSYVLVEVEDTGTGIPQSVVDQIFDPFFTTKEVGKGTGLGLSTSLTIIKSHGGFIRVYSEMGRGTRFRIYLPAIVGVEALRDSEKSAPPRGNGELILIVEDEAPIREILRSTLRRYGYEVLVAADGAEALATYVTGRKEIKLVLTDMTMPLLDGKSMILALIKIDPQVQVIASSGLSSNRRAVESLPQNVHSFLQKPYTAEVLLKAVAEALGK